MYIGGEISFSGERLTVAEDGIGTYQVQISRKEAWYPLPQIGTLRNAIAALATGGMSGCETFELTAIDQARQDGYYICNLTFKGIYQAGIVLVSVDGGAASEAIQHHPDFASWAGTATNPKFSVAYWEKLQQGTDTDPNQQSDVYKFNGFKADAPYDLGKVDSYQTTAYTVTLTDVRSSSDFDLPDKCTIGIPAIAGWDFGGSYLLESVSVEKQGSAYRRTRRFRKSGPTAWNPTIY